MGKNDETEAKERIVVRITEREKADLKIKLHSDGLTLSKFMRIAVASYLREDDSFMRWADEHLYPNSYIKSKVQRTKSKSLREEGKRIKDKFVLDEGEVSNIFDIIEKEYPEL